MTRATEESVELGPLDGPTTLTLSLLPPSERERYVDQMLSATLTSEGLHATALVCGGYLGFGGLVDIFGEMARQSWEGWEGSKEWSSPEHELMLSATMDRLGHVSLGVRLRPQPYPHQWSAEAVVQLEAGGLIVVHHAVGELIDSLR